MDMIGSATLGDVFDRACSAFPDKEFIVFEDRLGAVSTFTYAQAAAMVEQYAAIFARSGIAQGQRVLVHMHNRPSYLFTWFACAKIGAIMVPLNAQAGDFELDFCIDHCAASAVVTEHASFERFCALQKNHPGLRTIFLPNTLPEHEYPGAVLIDEERDCCLHACKKAALSNEEDLMWLSPQARHHGRRLCSSPMPMRFLQGVSERGPGR